MTTLEIKSSAGGTELIARRPGRQGSNASPVVSAACPPAASVPLQLRRHVEAARLIGAIGGEGQAKPAQLESALRNRQQFWVDTCREPREMRAASKSTLELHRKYGCLFFGPSFQQVQYILDALDAALPSWDMEHPELFFQTLELNFPSLLRNRRRGLFLA